MARRDKIIITAAVTGAIHTTSMSPYLPKGRDEIVQNAVDAYKAGASVIHLHARKSVTGEPTSELQDMREILEGIKKQCDAVIGITTGGALGMTIEERFAILSEFKPELATCNAGTFNFVLSELCSQLSEDAFEWERPFLERTYGSFYRNTFADIEYCLKTMNENGVKPEFEAFDLGQINNIAYFKKKGLVADPVYVQFVMGTLGGFPMDADSVPFFIKAAQRLLGADTRWSLSAGGRRMYRMETLNLLYGGNIRVGMEDSLYKNIRGDLAENNAVQVAKIRRVVEELDYEVARPGDVREMLCLKGLDKVNY